MRKPASKAVRASEVDLMRRSVPSELASLHKLDVLVFAATTSMLMATDRSSSRPQYG